MPFFSRIFRAAAAVLVLGVSATAHDEKGDHSHSLPPWQQASAWPDRVVVTMKGAPQTSFAVTWRTDATVASAVAEIVEATDNARFDLGARRVEAETEALDLQVTRKGEKEVTLKFNEGVPAVHFHSVEFTGLKPDTMYAYRVSGGNGEWSEWYQTKTAAEEGPLEFLYIGDAQNALRSHWSRLIRAAYQKAPEADFILHAGDLVNRASRDLEWAEWFEATGFIHGMIPAMPVAGNHEYDWLTFPDGERDRLLSIMWRPQFTLPEDPRLPDDLQEAAYELRYSEDVHFFIISTQNRKIEEQAAWLDARLGESNAKWKIVSMHHPVFSSGQGRDSPERRAALLPVIKKHGVDLVLQGHDHTYARGAIGQSPERLGFSDEGGDVSTMFVNSVSGPKQYEFQEGDWDGYAEDGVTLARKAENTQFFQIITIDGDTIEYKAMTALGNLYDDFVMTKSKDGTKTITRGAQSTMDERLFDNTGPYKTP